jgi:GTP-binding protein Era
MQTDAKPHRAGLVAIIGRPNVGKSTLLNTLLEYKLAIVSPRPQTTRHQILGVVSGAGYQIAFLDTPGFMARAGDTLDRRMLARARDSLEAADLVVMVVEPRPPGEIERRLVALLGSRSTPALLAINKVDGQKKEALLPVMENYSQMHPFLEIVPISALKHDGTASLLSLIASHLPEGPPLYEADMLTDRPERFLAEELVREQLFRLYSQEVPYDTAVEIEEFREAEEGSDGKDLIRAIVYVSKLSQRRILVGAGGAALKEVGIAARREIEAVLGRPVYLEIWVNVRPDWREDALFLEELGY